ncbi:MAG: ABC transporter permease subunit [Armatimonadetes bacterium]|jgi:ABC-2 type transport system permease protein|nr:ABC transporter permease subunit [Armatimonadota bacterium]
MTRLLRVEILKLSRRPRTYLGYAGILLLLVPMLLGLLYGQPDRHLRHEIGPEFHVVGTFVNALFMARRMMEPCLWFFLPLFIAMVAGDLVAGEAAEGTLRALLVRPVRRVPVLLAKFTVAVLHATALTYFLGLSALGLGALFFGWGDLILIEHGIYVLGSGEALARLAAAYTAAIPGMVVVAALALFLSVLVDNSNGAIIATMMLLFVSFTLGGLPYFEAIQPYLFTTHMGVWSSLFEDPIPWSEIARSMAWLAAYCIAFVGAAALVFSRKDILS